MIARFFVLLIRVYQRALSPLLGPLCRFSPSCSQYMLVCIERFGVVRGIGLGVHRLARCHPFNPGGLDLPPEAPTSTVPGLRASEHRGPDASLSRQSSKQTP